MDEDELVREFRHLPRFYQLIVILIQASRVDLIAFDSPFLTDPPAPHSAASSIIEPDFETIWGSLAKGNCRGWCEAPIEEVVRRLQGMQRRMSVKPADQAPFQGTLVEFPHEQILHYLFALQETSRLWYQVLGEEN